MSRGTPLFDRDRTLPGGLLAGVLFAAEFFCIFVGLQFTTASRMVVWIYIAPFVVALGMPLISRSERLSVLQSASGWCSPSPASPGRSPKASRNRTPARSSGSATPSACSPACSGARPRWRCAPPPSARPRPRRPCSTSSPSRRCCCSRRRPVGRRRCRERLSTLAWAALLFQVVIVTFASYLVWFWLIRHYPATRLSSFTMLTPVFGLAARRGAAGRAGDRAAAVRPGDGRGRHLPRQPEDGVIDAAARRSPCAAAVCAALAVGWSGARLRPGGVLFIAGLARHPAGAAAARPGDRVWQAMRQAQLARRSKAGTTPSSGRTVRVVEDADHQRWVRLADIRAIVGFTASDGRPAGHLSGRLAAARPAAAAAPERRGAARAHRQGADAGGGAAAPVDRARDRLSGAARARAARHPRSTGSTFAPATSRGRRSAAAAQRRMRSTRAVVE